MPYIMVRVILRQVMGGRHQVIVDCDYGNRELQSAMSRLAAMRNVNQSDCSYIVCGNPFAVLATLEEIGYKVVAANTARNGSSDEWQIWTLHRQA